MIGGLLLDLIIVVGSIAAFAWAGLQLGGQMATGRTLSVAGGVLAAVLLAPPIASRLPVGQDLASLVAVCVVVVPVYLAVQRLWRWLIAWRASRTGGGSGALDRAPVGAAAGALLGAGWAVVFMSVLVLLPSDSLLTRAAASSTTGTALIAQEGMLRWLQDAFPRSTQTLPKARRGAVVGERASIPLHGEEPVTHPRAQVAELLSRINRERRASRTVALVFNPDIAAVARRHADLLVADKRLSYRSSGGSSLDGQVRSALAESAGAFSPDVGTEVVWAHAPVHAHAALERSPRARRLLADARWSEIGIGAARSGWFNGTIYVLLLVGPSDPER